MWAPIPSLTSSLPVHNSGDGQHGGRPVHQQNSYIWPPRSSHLENGTTSHQTNPIKQKMITCIQKGYITDDHILWDYWQVFQELTHWNGVILKRNRLLIQGVEKWTPAQQPTPAGRWHTYLHAHTYIKFFYIYTYLHLQIFNVHLVLISFWQKAMLLLFCSFSIINLSF